MKFTYLLLLSALTVQANDLRKARLEEAFQYPTAVFEASKKPIADRNEADNQLLGSTRQESINTIAAHLRKISHNCPKTIGVPKIVDWHLGNEKATTLGLNVYTIKDDTQEFGMVSVGKWGNQLHLDVFPFANHDDAYYDLFIFSIKNAFFGKNSEEILSFFSEKQIILSVYKDGSRFFESGWNGSHQIDTTTNNLISYRACDEKEKHPEHANLVNVFCAKENLTVEDAKRCWMTISVEKFKALYLQQAAAA